MAHSLVFESREMHMEKRWWIETSEEDCNAYQAKAREYGSADLEVMGVAMEKLHPNVLMTRETGIEMALAFYLLGKIARMIGGYAVGQRPSDDTLHDIVVYAMMVRRRRFLTRADSEKAYPGPQ
jgi:hypothetical protein